MFIAVVYREFLFGGFDKHHLVNSQYLISYNKDIGLLVNEYKHLFLLVCFGKDLITSAHECKV